MFSASVGYLCASKKRIMGQDFIVSARKYRPQTFDDVVGQLHITGTLQNAVRSGKIAHAFLFCGPRGVGKTTCARIMAKVLNCENLSDSIEPCNRCASCEGFNTSHSFNIHELDAASNNGVDDIRQLIEQVRIQPQVGKYSIYIIDEVHMLTSQAFNAFLKTLEEPPKHAIFIMATTEKHKVLPTILSRCQVFDFRRITIDDIAGHLSRIAVKENIEADPDALHVIAQKADGALRDALSIFDRIVTFAGSSFNYKDVIDNLNILDHDYYFTITDQAHQGDRSGLMLTFHEILNLGFEGGHFLSGLSEHFRNLLMVQDVKTARLLEVGETARAHYQRQAGALPSGALLEALEIAHQAENQYKTVQNKRLLVEITLLRIARLLGSSGSAGRSESPAPAPTLQQNTSGQATARPATSAPTPRPAAPAPAAAPTAQLTATAETTETTKPGQPVPETTSMASAKPASQPRTLSLKQLREKKAEEAATVPTLKAAVNAGQLIQSWKNFAQQLRDQDRSLLASILLQAEPELQADGLTIVFPLTHKGQEPDLDQIRQDLLKYLGQQLENDFLTLQCEVRIREKVRTPYTSQEKLEDLSGRFPEVSTFIEKLDLQLA